MKKVMIAAIIVSLLALAACTTFVTIDSKPQGATVYIDGAPRGETPITQELSNLAFETYQLRLELEGYHSVYTSLEQEVKVGAAIGGFLFLPAWLWAYGPVDYQYYELINKK